jgi:hypothetical protein
VPLTSRLTDSSGVVLAGQIVAKPAGEGSDGLFNWSHGDSTGYLFHLLDATGMTGPGLIGIGIQNGGTGLVMAKHGPGLLFSVVTDASVTGDSMNWSNIGNGTLLKMVQGQTATPGPLLTLQAWSGAASHALSFQNTGGQEYGYLDNNVLFHLTNPAGHDLFWDCGSGVLQHMYVFATGTTYWSSAIQANSNNLFIKQATNNSNKGSETLNTMMTFNNGNALSFFAATPHTQFAAVTAPTGGTTVDTQARTAISSILAVLGAAAGGYGLTA